MAEAHDGTGGGLDLFLEWAGRTGEMNPGTANALRSTVGKILETTDDGDATDVTRIDVDAVLARFENLQRTNYSSGSLQTYKHRFRQAIAMYKAWLVQDPAWKTAHKPSASASGASRSNGSARVKKAPARLAKSTAEDDAPVSAMSGVRMVAYDLPLRPDLLVRLTLPVDLTEVDAARIAAFVKSVAFTMPPSPTATATTDAGG